MSSSRGNDLLGPLSKLHRRPELLYVYSRSGAKMDALQHAAYDYLEWTDDPTNVHMYFVAGLCDLTLRDCDRRWGARGYQEVLFLGSAEDTISRMKTLIDSISAHILYFGAKPCFSTIPPMSLWTWNSNRLEQKKTSFLLHSDHYADMQYSLNHTIRKVNQHITETNEANKMVTPNLASTLFSFHNHKSPVPRVHYNRLSDGVHPTDALTDKWALLINHAMLKNREIY